MNVNTISPANNTFSNDTTEEPETLAEVICGSEGKQHTSIGASSAAELATDAKAEQCTTNKDDDSASTDIASVSIVKSTAETSLHEVEVDLRDDVRNGDVDNDSPIVDNSIFKSESASHTVEYGKGEDSSLNGGSESRTSISGSSDAHRKDCNQVIPQKATKKQDSVHKESPQVLDTPNQDQDPVDNVDGQEDLSNQQRASIDVIPKIRPPRLTNLEPEEGRASLQFGDDPPETESSNVVRMFRNVRWVDPKHVHDENIHFDLVDAYEKMAVTGCVGLNSRLSNSSSLLKQPIDPPGSQIIAETGASTNNANTSRKESLRNISMLRLNKRARIATISSGFKTSNFFIREDVDTRIYFNEFEDAVNYLMQRGYVRMEKEDEEEWMKLIGKAHSVVKVGFAKKKQRYRKGKLLMVLSKQTNDSNCCDSSEITASECNSLGQSVRCGYKSYSEKFLSEQLKEGSTPYDCPGVGWIFLM